MALEQQNSAQQGVKQEESSCSPVPSCFNRKFLVGTSGWSDPSIGACGRFYPQGTGADRLPHYSRHFPHVEVDSSNYSIPPVGRVIGWCQQTPENFLFHFKAFALFCRASVKAAALPRTVRHLLPAHLPPDATISYHSCSSDLLSSIWRSFNDSLEAARLRGRLGFVIFQFHLNFSPSPENRLFVEETRKRLDKKFKMAVEFRDRKWWENQEELGEWLNKHDLTFIIEDDLKHETYHEAVPENPKDIVHLPILPLLTTSSGVYVRLHRRLGNQRILADWEIQDWIQRIKQIARRRETFGGRLSDAAAVTLKGPIFFLLGTDWEDQPVINARHLDRALVDYEKSHGEFETAASLHLPWKEIIKNQEKNSKKSLYGFFGAKQEGKLEAPENSQPPHEDEEKITEKVKTAEPPESPPLSPYAVVRPPPSSIFSPSPSKKRRTEKSPGPPQQGKASITHFFKKN